MLGKQPNTHKLSNPNSGVIEIIYSAKNATQVRVQSPPPKPLEPKRANFPSPPLLHPTPKPIHISKTSLPSESCLDPKPRSPPCRGQERKVGYDRETIHCCNGCRETFATEFEVLVHQAKYHAMDEFAGDTIERPKTPLTRNLERLGGDRVEGMLWVPPLSTRPKRWDGPPRKQKSSKSTAKASRVPERERSDKRSAKDTFLEKLARLDKSNPFDGKANSMKDRVPEWLQNLDFYPPSAMNRPDKHSVAQISGFESADVKISTKCEL